MTLSKEKKENGQEKREKIQYCFATTNVAFWEKKSLWEIPREWLYDSFHTF